MALKQTTLSSIVYYLSFFLVLIFITLIFLAVIYFFDIWEESQMLIVYAAALIGAGLIISVALFVLCREEKK